MIAKFIAGAASDITRKSGHNILLCRKAKYLSTTHNYYMGECVTSHDSLVTNLKYGSTTISGTEGGLKPSMRLSPLGSSLLLDKTICTIRLRRNKIANFAIFVGVADLLRAS